LSLGGHGQFQSLATGGFLASHLAIFAALKRVHRLHAREHKFGEFRLGGLLSGAHGQRCAALQMPALIANADWACNSRAPGLRYPAATITCA
jgi:hypothetical protein